MPKFKKREMVDLEEPVAILDEHTMPHPKDPKKLIAVTAERLQQIADNNNRRVSDTGDECPIVVGHTIDGAPAKFQPEVVGYAREFKVKPFFKTGRKALFARWRVFADRLDTLLTNPRRSVELWLGKWEIDPIALLGAETPDRDLGLIRLSRANGDSVISVFGENDMDPQQLVSEILAQLMQSPQMQFINALMEQVQAGHQGGMGGEMGGEPPMEEGPMGEEEVPPDMMGDEMPLEEENAEAIPEEEEEAEAEEEPVRRSAFGSGTNTFVPSEGPRKMSRAQASRKPVAAQKRTPADLANDPFIRKMVEEIQEARGLCEALVVKLARSEREKDLMRLQSENGIDLDVAEELEVVANEEGIMGQEQYQAYMDKVVRRYQRAPVNQDTIVTATGKIHSTNRQERAKRAAEYAIEKGVTFEDALKVVDGE